MTEPGYGLSHHKRTNSLNNGGAGNHQYQPDELFRIMLGNHVINQKPYGIGQHQSAESIDHGTQESDGQRSPPAKHNLPKVRPNSSHLISSGTAGQAMAVSSLAARRRAIGYPA